FKVLVGQTYTGFDDFPSQVWDSDANLVGYGMFYDDRKPMIQIKFENGFYANLQEPVKMDPVTSEEDYKGDDDNKIDAILPKINLGYRYNMDNMYIHPTFGFCMSNYNKDFSGYDETVMAYALALSFKYKFDDMMYMYMQGNYGQNVGDYGIDTSNISSKAGWNMEKNEVVDTNTMGGFFEFGYDKFAAGIGYIQSDGDAFQDPDAAMSAFILYNYQITNNLKVVPELGLVDEMEDTAGNKQGSMMYFGAKLQADF
ncbi:MAG: hypothetical protein PHR06_11745, partial [Candidatus Cloacimonetes bacterium]|nr:hypothetical protein [Candidatus Cloacimonadota bacterium]